MSTYDSHIKRVHRAVVMELSRDSSYPILYLDDAGAGATRFFRDHGVPSKRLVPVNYDATACTSIKKITHVSATWDDINALMMRHRTTGKRYGVVWLDYECRSMDCVYLDAALTIAPFVCITLSTRGVEVATIIRNLQRTIKQCKGVVLEQPCVYKGKSGITNMSRFVIQSTTFQVNIKALKQELKRTMQRRDLVCRQIQKMTRRQTPAQLLVGSLLAIPETQWSDTSEYDEVKRRNGCLLFRVSGTHYTNKLRIRAVQTNNRPAPHDETWWLKVQDAVGYSVH